MSVVINTNSDALRIQNTLTSATNKLSQTMQRMSSGLKINSAKDDAAGTVISARMIAQLNGNKICQNNVQNANSLLATAEGNIDVVLDNITRIRDLTLQAKNGTYSKEEIQAMQDEVAQRIAEIDRVSDSAKFSQLQLFGEKDASGAATGLNKDGATFQVGTNSQSYNVISADDGLFKSIEFNSLLGGSSEANIEFEFKGVVTNNTDPSSANVGDVLFNSTDNKFYICKESTSGSKEWVEDSDLEYAKENYIGKEDTPPAASKDYLGKVVYDNTNETYKICEIDNPNTPTYKWTEIDNTVYKEGDITSEKDYSLKGAVDPATGHYDSASKRLYGNGEPTTITAPSTYADAAAWAARDAGVVVKTADNTYNVDDVMYCEQDDSFYICTKGTQIGSVKLGDESATYEVITGYAEWEKLDNYYGDLQTTTYTSTGDFAAATGSGKVCKVADAKDSSVDGYYMDMKKDGANKWVKIDNYQEKENGTSGLAYSEENPFDLTKMVAGDGNVKGSFGQAIDALDKAIDNLTARKSSIGSLGNRLDSALDTLTTQYTNLTSAKSVITDSDIAAEASIFTQNQILQQVSTSLLAQANQAPSVALSLL